MVLKIFLRDLKRIFTNIVAIIVILGVCFIPALYAWFNIYANLDPYSKTSNLNIAVVNADRGTTLSLNKGSSSRLNLGDQVIDSLKDNKQLGWTFVSQREALDGVHSGKYYAAILLPKNFSSAITSILSGEIERPKIIYYSNEKENAIAPKVTDTGASGIQEKVNETFVQVVSDTLTNEFNRIINSSGTSLDKKNRDIKKKLAEAELNLRGYASTIDNFKTTVSDANDAISEINTLLTQLETASENARKSLSQSLNFLKQAQKSGFTTLTDINSQMDTLSSSLLVLQSDMYSALSSVNGTIGSATGKAQAVTSELQTLVDMNGDIINRMQTLHNLLASDTLISNTISSQLATLTAQNQSHRELLNDLQSMNNALDSMNYDLSKLNTAVNDSVTSFNGQMQTMRTQFLSSALTASQQGLNSASTAVLTGQNMLDEIPDQTEVMRKSLHALKRGLRDTNKALSASGDTVLDAAKDIHEVRTDLNALTSSQAYKQLTAQVGIDSEELAEFFANPIRINTKVFYPVKNYGSAMAPFYTNLALWVSGIILAAILKLRADENDEIPEITGKQAYFGRWLLFIFFGLIQAAIIGIGDLYLLKVQCLHPIWFMFACLVSAFVFITIEYTLCLTLNHIGRALCVLMVILQIPGSSGTYPIEMTPDFFQRLHPLLPFSYSIDAMRETIAGYYGSVYAKSLGILMIFVALSLFVGLVIRPLMQNLNNLFDDRLARTGFMVCEKETDEPSGASLSQMLKLLTEEQDGREMVIERGIRFEQKYPARVRRGFLSFIIIPLIFLVLAFGIDNKLVFLTLWVISLIVIAIYLIILEYIHDNLVNRVGIQDVPQEELLERIRALRIARKHHRKGDK